MIINAQNNFLHNLVCCVITRSFLKNTDLNITEFFPFFILLFPEDCTSSDLSQDPSDKKVNY